MHAEILTIGDELCRGEIVDTNSSYLAARLWDLDITTRWMTSVNDHDADLEAALSTAVGRADVVVCSGGLGPTEDDLTVEMVARLAGVGVEIDETSRRRMEERFGAYYAREQAPEVGTDKGVGGRPRPATPQLGARREELMRIQLRQVRTPAGARVFANPAGLAPGFEIDLRGVPVICLPGIPRELYAIMDDSLAARLAELREAKGDVERIAKRIYRAFGRGESQISQACRGLVDGVAGASIHYQVKFPETLVKLVVRDRDGAAAQARLDAMDGALRERLKGVVYGTGDETLIERVARRLVEAKRTVASAESCTGGMVGEMLTRQPGSSRAYLGGAITYTNEEKVRQLGVRPDTLAAHGAVSEQTVREMSAGALVRFGTDLAVAVSGVAGPDGGTPDKPVGTVWLALARRGPRDEAEPARSWAGSVTEGDNITAVHVEWTTKKLGWPGARDQIRMLSSWWALKLLDEALPPSEPGERGRP